MKSPNNGYNNYFYDFINYCKKINIFFVHQLDTTVYIDFRAEYNIDNVTIKKIKARVNRAIINKANENKRIDEVFWFIRQNSEFMNNTVEDIEESHSKYYDLRDFRLNATSSYIEKIESLLDREFVANIFDSGSQEQIVLDAAKLAIDVVGIELCREAYYDPSRYIIAIVNKMDIFVEESRIYQNRVKQLKKQFSTIDDRILQCRMESFIYAFESNDSKIIELREFSKKINRIENISKYFHVIANDENLFLQTENFIDFLLIDMSETIQNLFSFIYKRTNDKGIIKLRAFGETLKTIGNKLDLTSERVRQIEKKAINRFENHQFYQPILLKVYALQNKEHILEENCFMDALPHNQHEILYLFKISKDNRYSYNKEFGIFIIGDIDFDIDAINDCIENMPKFFFFDDKEKIIEEFSKNCNMSRELVEAVINKKYEAKGKVYQKFTIGLSDKYMYILEKYYPHGIKLAEEDIKTFMHKIVEIFGGSAKSQRFRAVVYRIMDVAILCDKGSYLHPSHANVSDETIQLIDDFICNSDRTSLTYSEIYENLKEELLLNSSINNYYYLHGVIKHFLKDKYYIRRDYISKNENTSVDNEIYDYIKNSKHEIFRRELKEKFNGITEPTLMRILCCNKDIISYGNGRITTSDRLDICESDYNMRETIVEETATLPVSSKKLFKIMYSKYINFMIRNNIDTHSKLFGILKYMFSDEFKFSVPFISQMEGNNLTNI